MREEVTELNENIETIGDSIVDTAVSLVDVSTQLINIPWIIYRAATEETGGLVDEISGEL